MNDVAFEYGIVKSKKRGYYYVTVEKSAKCGSCKICDFGSKNSITIPCTSTIDANVGDKVAISSIQKKNYLSSFVLYFIPIIFIVLGAIISDAVANNGLIVLLSCFACAVVGILAVALLDKVLRKNYMSRIIEIVK